MDSHKRSTQVERLEVIETGRRRRWSDDEKLRIVLESCKRRDRYRRQRDAMTMAAITHVFTISGVAEMLGEDKDWLDEISIELDPEDGRLTVWDLDEDGTTAFTRFGIDNLTELVQIYKANPNLLPRPPEPAAELSPEVGDGGNRKGGISWGA
jgi:hypothetical protein